jgi:DnaJ-class molecular chaperone
VRSLQHRSFFVALGVPRGADADAVRPAYRRLVTRYRRVLDDAEDALDEPTEPPAAFAVMRSYSERRHGALFDAPNPLAAATQDASEVDRFFEGHVPEVAPPPRAQRGAGKDLFVELRIAAEEARRGGIFPVHIPVHRRCNACVGTAEDARLACPVCHGAGQTTVDRMVEVTTPPGVAHGQVARLAMEDAGLDETDLVVLIVVG